MNASEERGLRGPRSDSHELFDEVGSSTGQVGGAEPSRVPSAIRAHGLVRQDTVDGEQQRLARRLVTRHDSRDPEGRRPSCDPRLVAA